MAKVGKEDTNAEETREWLASLEYILENDGVDRANFLLERLSARKHSCRAICSWNAAYAA